LWIGQAALCVCNIVTLRVRLNQHTQAIEFSSESTNFYEIASRGESRRLAHKSCG
jgi:hypothetical protein